MGEAIVIGLIVIVLCVLGYYQIKGEKELLEKGLIIQRDDSFWENGELLFCSVGYQDVLTAVNQADFRPCQVSVTPNYNGEAVIVFHNQRFKWNAALSYYGEQNGEHSYEFEFVNWRARNHMVQGEVMMNILMTTIEKLFLALDPNTEAELHFRDAETRTRFL